MSEEPDKGGRPLNFKTPEEMELKVNEYFESFEKGEEPVLGTKRTTVGLALFLGFESRQSLYDYEKRDGFSYIVKKARSFIEMNYEEMLDSKSCTGAIFALKNMGWIDRTEVDQKTTNIPNNKEDLEKELGRIRAARTGN